MVWKSVYHSPHKIHFCCYLPLSVFLLLLNHTLIVIWRKLNEAVIFKKMITALSRSRYSTNFYGTQMLITVFTTAWQCIPSCTISIQSTPKFFRVFLLKTNDFCIYSYLLQISVSDKQEWQTDTLNYIQYIDNVL